MTQQKVERAFVILELDPAQQLANYLTGRPFGEVNGFMQMFSGAAVVKGFAAEAAAFLAQGNLEAAYACIATLLPKKPEEAAPPPAANDAAPETQSA